MTQWCLAAIEIEGFRGINNEGDPFALEISCDKITSISAQNAVGKSSIYEAICLAFRGHVPRLEALHTAEKASLYYINRFFGGAQAAVRLRLREQVSASEYTIEVLRAKNGTTTISSPDHPAPADLLRSLNREFVLLDYGTLQNFMQDSPLERGRSFSKLLGLAEYSEARAKLRALANTNAFNNFFGLNTLDQRIIAAKKLAAEQRVAAYKAASDLCHMDPAHFADDAAVATHVLTTLKALPTLACVSDATDLAAVNFETCFAAIADAEGGEERKKYVALTQRLAEAQKLGAGTVSSSVIQHLKALAEAHETALAETAGTLRQQLLEHSRSVLESEGWMDPTICPTCEQQAPFSVLELVSDRLEQYAAVDLAAAKLKAEWALIDWTPIQQLEAARKDPTETALFAGSVSAMNARIVSAATLATLSPWLATLEDKHQTYVDSCKADAEALAKKLPKSLVEVTKLVGEGKSIREKLSAAAGADGRAQSLEDERAIAARIKGFLDKASDQFSTAEAVASKARMAAVLPLVQQLFCSIMTNNVIPSLHKDGVGEDLKLVLTKFWSETDVDALPVLSESYKNALGISIFMASAKLYSGPPRFIILDDITSSFDGGSQYFTMETLRKHIARPAIPDGLQLVILSHDPLLEKYFARAVQDGDWEHKRVQGNPKTLLMVTDITGENLRKKLIKMLDAGLVDNVDAGVRQYIEAKLMYIIQRVCIRVPIDFAVDDNKKMIQNAIDAIQQQVSLYKQVGTLVLTGPQEGGISTSVAAIIGNFMAHYATASSGAIGEAALRATIAAVDALEGCFTHVDTQGQRRFYKALDKVA